MHQANTDLRLLARGSSIPLWAIAEKLSISEQTLIRRWRKELASHDKEKIRGVIAELVQEAQP